MITFSSLKSVGLSENEARVYLAMLELGPSAVVEIAKKAKINRPTAYFQMESLKDMGLVSTQTKGKKQLFIAESPDQLEKVLSHQINDLEEKKRDLLKILPSLNDIYVAGDTHPQVRFFEGKEGLLRMQEYVLASGVKEVVAIASLDEIFDVFPKHTEDYSSRRIQAGIRSKLIYTSSKGPILKESDSKMLRESKFISPERMPFSGDVTMYGNFVAITALKGKVSGIIIEHPQIAESFRNFFKFLWEFSK